METRKEQGAVLVVGHRWSPAAHEVKDYLARNRVPYRWLEVGSDPEGRRLAAEEGASDEELPLLVFPDGSRLSRPSDEQIAERIGLSTEAESPFYDLVVVGAGPAGLSAAVYGGSEGLRTLVVEREAPGGQAGMSAHIENYLGFPGGISGAELAERAVEQARGFGVELVVARAVVGLRAEEPYRVVKADGGDERYCHTVLLAMGVDWRVLEAPGCRELIGRGVYYGAAAAEATTCRDQDVYLLGGGNSAGQAAMLLSRYARSVTLVAPERDFADRMSEYLLARLERTPNVEFRPGATVSAATGDGRLQTVTIEELDSGAREERDTGALFVFIGAAPTTRWLGDTVACDEAGYVLTGKAAGAGASLETSLPGVFAAGDIRAGSVKRVGAAVGEGATAIQQIHDYLQER